MKEDLITDTAVHSTAHELAASKSIPSDYFILSPFVACLVLFLACASCSSKNQTKLITETTVTAKDLIIGNITNTTAKKKQFFDFMRPIINQENNKILALRKKLMTARIYNNNTAFVEKTAGEYHVDWNKNGSSKEKNWDKLLERVDAISLEVALAQSANESAWGQSRFAQQGNNFFGQWCYKKGCGIVPKKRAAKSKHEVARYSSVNESVRSYIKNINTTRAYAPLRKIRKENRDNKKSISAKDQATGLTLYSQRKDSYVKEIIQLIETNKNLMIGKG